MYDIIWESDCQSFFITSKNELFVRVERGEFLVVQDDNHKYLKVVAEKYMEKLFDMVDNFGYDTVDMIIYPETKTVKFFKENHTLGVSISYSEIKPKPKIGDKFAVHFEYMDENEIREETIKSVAWSDRDKEWMVSNTPKQFSVDEMEDMADTYSVVSESKNAYSLVA